ncbi:MAG: leucine-rich repeat domain-containing protein, partial [Oscillospiraceae bacterium]|nr:leucine-rich repeat domain-containing protein [Oscillospiraceae bacterium]
MKKIFTAVLMLLALCLVLQPLSASAEEAVVSGICGDNLTWTYADGVLSISGTGPMYDFEIAPWDDYTNDIKGLYIEEGVSTIGKNAFRFFASLENAIIPASVTHIEEMAFYTSNLHTLTIKGDVEVIGSQAFAHNELETLTFLGNVGLIDELAFLQNFNLQTINFHGSVEKIGTRAFLHCTGLTQLILPEGLREVGEEAFGNCESMETLTLPSTLEVIHTRAFVDNYMLDSLEIPASVRSIGAEAFYNCTISYVTFLGDAPELVENAFFYWDVETQSPQPYRMTQIFYPAEAQGYSDPAWEVYTMIGVLPSVKVYHTLNLSSNISINYMVKKSDFEGFDSLRIACKYSLPASDGSVYIYHREDTPEENETYYVYNLNSPTALTMMEKIHFIFYAEKDGKTYAAPLDEYCVADYAYNMLNRSNAPAALKTLCADLLRYGAKAQLFKGFRIDRLADSLMTEEHKSYLSDMDAVTFGNNNEILETVEAPTVLWAGKSLNLNDRVELNLFFKLDGYEGNPEDLELNFSYVNHAGEEIRRVLAGTQYREDQDLYVFVIHNIDAADLRSVISATICGEYEDRSWGPVSQTLVYSCDTYGNGKTYAAPLDEYC